MITRSHPPEQRPSYEFKDPYQNCCRTGSLRAPCHRTDSLPEGGRSRIRLHVARLHFLTSGWRADRSNPESICYNLHYPLSPGKACSSRRGSGDDETGLYEGGDGQGHRAVAAGSPLATQGNELSSNRSKTCSSSQTFADSDLKAKIARLESARAGSAE